MSDNVVQFTNAGLAELISAKNKGIKAELTHIAAGDRSYKPLATQKTLVNERQRVPILEYEDISTTQLRLGAKFDGNLEYEVREIGFFLSTGTLLCVYSAVNTLLTYKSANSTWIQKFNLDISPVPTGSITVVVGTENLNLMLVEELMLMATAFVISETVQIKTSHQQLLISERLRSIGA